MSSFTSPRLVARPRGHWPIKGIHKGIVPMDLLADEASIERSHAENTEWEPSPTNKLEKRRSTRISEDIILHGNEVPVLSLCIYPFPLLIPCVAPQPNSACLPSRKSMDVCCCRGSEHQRYSYAWFIDHWLRTTNYRLYRNECRASSSFNMNLSVVDSLDARDRFVTCRCSVNYKSSPATTASPIRSPQLQMLTAAR